MIKDNQKYFNRLHLLVDAVVVAISYLFAWYLKFCTILQIRSQAQVPLDMGTYFGIPLFSCTRIYHFILLFSLVCTETCYQA